MPRSRQAGVPVPEDDGVLGRPAKLHLGINLDPFALGEGFLEDHLDLDPLRSLQVVDHLRTGELAAPQDRPDRVLTVFSTVAAA